MVAIDEASWIRSPQGYGSLMVGTMTDKFNHPCTHQQIINQHQQ